MKVIYYPVEDAILFALIEVSNVDIKYPTEPNRLVNALGTCACPGAGVVCNLASIFSSISSFSFSIGFCGGGR